MRTRSKADKRVPPSGSRRVTWLRRALIILSFLAILLVTTGVVVSYLYHGAITMRLSGERRSVSARISYVEVTNLNIELGMMWRPRGPVDASHISVGQEHRYFVTPIRLVVPEAQASRYDHDGSGSAFVHLRLPYLTMIALGIAARYLAHWLGQNRGHGFPVRSPDGDETPAESQGEEATTRDG